MVELVIKIPCEILKGIYDGVYCGISDQRIYDAIRNGTPLPKHGRLIDSDEFDKTLKDGEIKARKQRKYILETAINTIRGNLKKADTIIEADVPKRRKGTPREDYEPLYDCENWIP